MSSSASADAGEARVQSRTRGATVNPCTLCAPLGAVLASAGVEGALPLLHGAQGCATYIRRYLISHFREPVDVASSSLGESQTVLGGESNLHHALDNIVEKYAPQAVAVATTCVCETIGEDLSLMLRKYQNTRGKQLAVVHASTPSYKGGHLEGFHAMVQAMVVAWAVERGSRLSSVNVLPPPISPADLRELRRLIEAFGVAATILPDYSETLDGAILGEYHALRSGGTPLSEIARMPRALASFDFTMTGHAPRASDTLATHGVRQEILGLPIGVRATDAFLQTLAQVCNRSLTAELDLDRGRLLDAYADGHKYVFGKRIGIYGDPEWVIALARFALEIGARPVFCATGARNRALSRGIEEQSLSPIDEVLEDTDFSQIEAACRRTQPDLLLGNSKGYSIARKLSIPLLRLGFPIHDRIGASRILTVGYRGTTWLFDAIVNALLEKTQQSSPIGFSYL